MRFIYYNKKTFDVPEMWNELTKDQVVSILPLLFSGSADFSLRIRLFKILSGWSWWRMTKAIGLVRYKQIESFLDMPFVSRHIDKYLNRCAVIAEAIIDCTEFLLTEPVLTINKIPEYRGFYGPADELENLKIAEFLYCEISFLTWKQTDSHSDLNDLISFLYRKKRVEYDHLLNPDGDHREPLNPHVCKANSLIIDRWPYPIKLAIATFYQGCRLEKINSNADVFDDSSVEDESIHGLWSVMREIAKSGHFGDFDKVQDQYVDTILMELKEVQAEAKRRTDDLERLKQRQ